jgi:hypothetical protein
MGWLASVLIFNDGYLLCLDNTTIFILLPCLQEPDIAAPSRNKLSYFIQKKNILEYQILFRVLQSRKRA